MIKGPSVRMSRFPPAVSLLFILNLCSGGYSHAQSSEQLQGELSDTVIGGVQDLYLEVFINDEPVQMVAAARRSADGKISMPADQLRGVGIATEGAVATPDGYVLIEALAGVTYRLDEAAQAIYFDALNEARAARQIGAPDENDSKIPELSSSIGAVLNYSLFANFTSDRIFATPAYHGLSGSFDMRIFSPLGVLQSGFIATTSPSETYSSTRLDTNWSYSSPNYMVTYRAGDIIAGGLSWTRPVRLGGFQLQRNFNLRPDLVTMPLPELGGTAAVPSTVEIFANNIRRFSGEVGSGPFEVSNVPFSSGPGTVQIVVRDRFGRETVQEVPFYASSRMLAPGLLDFSLDGGFARRDFGLRSDNYDGRFMAAGSLRYGLFRRLTLEAHAEGGEDLVSGGGAALFNIGSFGIASTNFSASHSGGETGYRVGGSIEAALGRWRLFASSQRTFGAFNDIASVTARTDILYWRSLAKLPRVLDQVTVSAPPFRDGSTLNLNFANIQDADGYRSSVVGASYSRGFLGNSTLYVNGYADVSRSKSYGLFMGLSMNFGQDTLSTGMESTANGTRVMADYIHPLGQEPWSMGWRLHGAEGGASEKMASVAVRTPIARLEGIARQADAGASGSLQMSGAIATAGGGVFASERIHDAFAVVDAGAPGVAVRYQNRFVGKTGRNGKLLVPNLISLHKSALEIDPSDLPVDVDVPMTREAVTPAEKSGVVVKFGISPNIGTALVTLTLADGTPVPVGAEGRLIGSEEEFTVGYDGQTFLRGLEAANRVEITLPETGETCGAAFAFKAVAGQQVALDNVVCQ